MEPNLPETEEERAGKRLAFVTLGPMRASVTAMDEDARLHWWGGFLASVAGMMAASLGPATAGQLLEELRRAIQVLPAGQGKSVQ